MRSRLRRAWSVRPLLVAVAGLALTAAGAGSARASALLARVETRAVGRGVAIALLAPGTRDLKVTAFTLDNPSRLIFDLKEAALARGLQSSLALSLPGISAARLGQYRSDPDVARLVLDLAESAPPPTWNVTRGPHPGETLIVLEPAGPVTLPTPTVEKTAHGLAVRLAGAGGLQRCTAALDNPPRVFTDLANATLEVNCRKGFSSGPIREIRMAQQAPDGDTPVARLVIELRESQEYSESVDGEDLVLAFGRPPARERAKPKPLKGKIIVVDPGHGGKDSGALSDDESDQVQEKDVVLDIGLRLAQLLRERGAEVVMTREDDTFIPLGARSDTANRLNADAFVSIHCNSCDTPNTLHGTSVYYDHLDSVPLAAAVQEELIAVLESKDNGIRSANFSVIRRSQCPGVLVETAFINHEEDRKLLTDPESRRRMAEAIVRGVIRFFSETPPSGGPTQ